jgi:FkbM family methyltransferase
MKNSIKRILQSILGIENYLFAFQKYLMLTYEAPVINTIPYYRMKYRDLRCLIDHVPVGGVCIDVGANIGFYAAKMAQKVEIHGKVYAFEPLSICFNTLKKSIPQGVRDRVVLEKMAVSNSISEVDIFLPIEDGAVMHGFTSISESSDPEVLNRGKLERVASTTLDEYFKALGYPEISLIKIDVEGYEIGVIEGSLEVISRHKPTIVCEIQHNDNSFDVVFDLLESRGYQASFLGVSGLEKVDKSKLGWNEKIDYFFLAKT